MGSAASCQNLKRRSRSDRRRFAYAIHCWCLEGRIGELHLGSVSRSDAVRSRGRGDSSLSLLDTHPPAESGTCDPVAVLLTGMVGRASRRQVLEYSPHKRLFDRSQNFQNRVLCEKWGAVSSDSGPTGQPLAWRKKNGPIRANRLLVCRARRPPGMWRRGDRRRL